MRPRRWCIPVLAAGLALGASACGHNSRYGSFSHPGENRSESRPHPRSMTVPSPQGRGSEHVFTTVPGTTSGRG